MFGVCAKGLVLSFQGSCLGSGAEFFGFSSAYVFRVSCQVFGVRWPSVKCFRVTL